MIDVLALIKQFKEFIKEEKGTFLLLLAILGVIFFMTGTIHDNLKEAGVNISFFEILFVLYVPVILLWGRSRRLGISRKKINVSIAHMEVNTVDLANPLTWDQKVNVSDEIVSMIYTSLQHQKQALTLERYLNFVELPTRIKVGYENHEAVPSKTRSDILVWGVLRSQGGKVFYNSKIDFRKSVDTELFDKLESDIQSSQEIEYDLADDNNPKIDKLMHMVTYLGLLFYALKEQNAQNYEQCAALADSVLIMIDDYRAKPGSRRTKDDKDMLLLEAIFLYVRAKALHNQANNLLQSFDKDNRANELLIEAGKDLRVKGDILKKYFPKEFSPDEYLEHSYLYSVSLLAEANDDSRAEIIKKLKADSRLSDRIDLVDTLLSVRFEDGAHALRVYQDVLDKEPENRVALRALGLEYYRSHKNSQALELLSRLDAIDQKHIFHESLYDLAVQEKLAMLYLKRLNLYKAMDCLKTLARYSRYNRQVKRAKYIM